MSSQLVDALPYIDHEYNDSQVRLAVSVYQLVCQFVQLIICFVYLLGRSNGGR